MVGSTVRYLLVEVRAKADARGTAGNLALSRALGDFEFKQNAHLDAEHQVVTADPDITIHDATPEDEFLVIACDGSSLPPSYRAHLLTRNGQASGTSLLRSK